MSEIENTDKPAPVVDAEFDEPGFDPGPADEPPPARRKRRWVRNLWLLLFLLLAAATAYGYWYLRIRDDAAPGAATPDALAELRRETDERLAAARSAVVDIEARLAALEARGGEDDAGLDLIRESLAELDELTESVESFTPRLLNVERTLAELQGISVDSRNLFLLAEAEYYLQIGNAQLQLANNPELAALALGQADDRLAQVADPALTDTRRAIAGERAALDGMEKPDISGTTLTLGSLAQVAESLPVRTARAAYEAGQAPAKEEAGGVGRAWHSVQDAFSGMFDYTPPDDPDRPLLTPGAEPLIRSNLALQLQAARLALLRGEQELFRQSVEDAERWLSAYFDTGSAGVQSALETLGDIGDEFPRVEKPDISGSLHLLRQYRALAEAPQ